VKIYSIFSSVDGEVNNRGMGAMTTFVRLAGCSADCSYCDTEYAKSSDSGVDLTIAEIMQKIASNDCNNVTITGGEPLEQFFELSYLVEALNENEYNVSIETNGLQPFTKLHTPWNKAHWVVDLKKETNQTAKMFQNMHLDRNDYIKMVIGSYDQFIHACDIKRGMQLLNEQATFAFSPEYGVVSPDELLKWMKQHKQMDAVLNVQLHKILSLTEAN
jgi:7-carboxy-7-deazaguanine synthase